MSYKSYINSKGYEIFKDSGIPVHRWAAQKRIKRKLKPGEVVHHIDRDKRNNNPSNLWVCKDQKQHDAIHKADAKRFGKRKSFFGF
jgi:hypothetical protein